MFVASKHCVGDDNEPHYTSMSQRPRHQHDPINYLRGPSDHVNASNEEDDEDDVLRRLDSSDDEAFGGSPTHASFGLQTPPPFAFAASYRPISTGTSYRPQSTGTRNEPQARERPGKSTHSKFTDLAVANLTCLNLSSSGNALAISGDSIFY